MGLPPAHVKTMSVVLNPEPRRWLSQFFAGLLDKTEKSGTIPATWATILSLRVLPTLQVLRKNARNINLLVF